MLTQCFHKVLPNIFPFPLMPVPPESLPACIFEARRQQRQACCRAEPGPASPPANLQITGILCEGRVAAVPSEGEAVAEAVLPQAAFSSVLEKLLCSPGLSDTKPIIIFSPQGLAPVVQQTLQTVSTPRPLFRAALVSFN